MPVTQDIHNDIEPWLAEAVHGQLSENEGHFEQHLAACERCRTLHQQTLSMHNMIATTFESEKPDLTFEQRIVSGFCKNVPHRTRFRAGLTSLWRSRPTQIAAVAAALVTMVQVGRLVTNESASPVEGLRRLPSFVGITETENDSDGADETGEATPKRKTVTGSYIPTPQAESAEPMPSTTVYSARVEQRQGSNAPAPATPPVSDAAPPAMARQDMKPPQGDSAPVVPPDANRKLIRNAQVEIEIPQFGEAVDKITAFANEAGGYVATSSSTKQANGKLRGTVVVKVLPDRLDAFLTKLRELGDVKNQTLGTDDVTKQYLDTESRLNNARLMEQRLLEILKTKSNKVADLLEVEKELGRVRAEIERMQGEIKYMDALVAFATVTITLAEKNMDLPAAFLLKRRAQLALFSTDVEKTFNEAKAIVDGAKAQISSSSLDRDSLGQVTARLVLLIVPEEADAFIARLKGMGRVQNYQEETERVAQGGSGMGENAKVERDKVQVSVTISRNEQEPALQTTSLRILTSEVTQNVARLKENAAKSGAEIRSSSFSRDPDGQEIANITLRVAMNNYAPLMSSFDQLGKVKDVSVQREDRRGIVNEETAPADISIQVYSEGRLVSDETGLWATLRNTIAQGAAALMWSLRMIGVAVAFLAPWVLALGFFVWIARWVSRARAARRGSSDAAE